jgi:hypothetical protein
MFALNVAPMKEEMAALGCITALEESGGHVEVSLKRTFALPFFR